MFPDLDFLLSRSLVPERNAPFYAYWVMARLLMGERVWSFIQDRL